MTRPEDEPTQRQKEAAVAKLEAERMAAKRRAAEDYERKQKEKK